MERAVAADTGGETLDVQLSVADRAMSTQLVHDLVMCCESGALRTLERAGETQKEPLKYEFSTGTPLAEPLKVALVQRGVKDTDVLNHLVTHGSQLNTYASACEEVRNILHTRATLMKAAQPMDIGALDRRKDKEKGKGKKGDKGKGKGRASRVRAAHEKSE